MIANQLWFVKHEGKVLGHFPIKEIAHSLSVGEVTLNDEISPDQVNWLPLSRFPGLIPEPLPQPPPEAEETLDEEQIKWRDERAKAAIRWDRPLERSEISAPAANPRLKWVGAVTALLAVAGLLVFIALQWQEPMEQPKALVPTAIPNCNVVPAPKVNWRGCDKSGILLVNSDFSAANLSRAKFNSTDLSTGRFLSANLTQTDFSYATLNQANMAYANLEAANLNFAELRGTDLSHANLRDANVAGAVLDGAKLDDAIWIDGRVCAAGSIGECR